MGNAEGVGGGILGTERGDEPVQGGTERGLC